jgi:hypothetical protein
MDQNLPHLQYVHHDRGTKHLVATFNSRGREWGYEWEKALKESGYSSLHILGEKRGWYHSSIEETLEVLKEFKPNLLIGASMGGYAALLFGGLLGIKARAFGPQTTLEDVPWDLRWQHEWGPLRLSTKHPELLDLAGLSHLPASQIYYCEGVQEDRLHAERLKVEVIARGCELHEQASQNLHRGVFD